MPQRDARSPACREVMIRSAMHVDDVNRLCRSSERRPMYRSPRSSGTPLRSRKLAANAVVAANSSRRPRQSSTIDDRRLRRVAPRALDDGVEHRLQSTASRR